MAEKKPDPTGELGPQLHCVSHMLRRALDAAICARVDPGLSGMRGFVLGYIVRCNAAGQPVYQRDIETRLHIRRSSVTALLQGMEQAGYITRANTAADARLKSLTVTDKGLACNDAIQDCILDFERALRRGIAPDEMAVLDRALQQLLENARALEKAPGGTE